MKYYIKREGYLPHNSYLSWYNKERKEIGWGDIKNVVEFDEDYTLDVKSLVDFKITLISVKEG